MYFILNYVILIFIFLNYIKFVVIGFALIRSTAVRILHGYMLISACVPKLDYSKLSRENYNAKKPYLLCCYVSHYRKNVLVTTSVIN